jgi:hypothetical protein
MGAADGTFDSMRLTNLLPARISRIIHGICALPKPARQKVAFGRLGQCLHFTSFTRLVSSGTQRRLWRCAGCWPCHWKERGVREGGGKSGMAS